MKKQILKICGYVFEVIGIALFVYFVVKGV